MSTASAMRRAYAVRANSVPEFRQAAATPEVESALERITAWIPTEVVATYVALLGLFEPKSDLSRWILFLIAGVLVPTFVLVNGAIVNKRGARAWKASGRAGDPPKITGNQLGWCVILAFVAYVAWAMALPSTPFLDWFDVAPKVGGALVVVLALLLPKVAELLDLELPRT